MANRLKLFGINPISVKKEMLYHQSSFVKNKDIVPVFVKFRLHFNQMTPHLGLGPLPRVPFGYYIFSADFDISLK
jgi:hypothetical protein